MDEPMDTASSAGSDVDAALVAAALSGNRDALGGIYDRHADRVHTMCVHMLSDRDEAADVCGEVFLVAFQRLGQLREPARLKSWLFAIARHEVYRRTKQRSRVQLIEEVEQMDRMSTTSMHGTAAHDLASSFGGDVEEGGDGAGLVLLVRDAAQGLDERDRMVMELQLQGLDGDDLAGALGTSTSTAYQHVHRMKERLGRSLGAVLIARQGREDCDELDRLLAGWDGTFSVLWRKRVARHIDGCEVCERRRKAVPAALLSGTAIAAPMVGASAVSAAPASVRERVLRDARVGGVGHAGWRRDGFPPHDRADRRTPSAAVLVAAGLVILLLLLVLAALLWGPASNDELEIASADGEQEQVATTASTLATPTTTSSTLAVVPDTIPADDPVLPPPDVSPPTVVGGGQGQQPVNPEPGDRAEVPQPAPTTQPPIGQEPPPPPPPPPAPIPPAVTITAAPGEVFHPTVGFPNCGASTAFTVSAPTATSVVLRWTWSTQGGQVALSPQSDGWSGVLEVPSAIAGPLTIVAVAVDGAGTEGSSSPISRPVQNCITPG